MALTITRAVVAFIAGALLVPFIAHGQTVAEMQQQVAELLARLSALQAELSAVGGQTGGTGDYTTGGDGTGVLNGGLTLHRDIGRGDKGDDVARLQTFLARDPSIYPDAQITSFFGPLTEAAVRRFQVACAIVQAGDYNSTGYGRVGPRTRQALLSGCGIHNTGVVGALLRVTPSAGHAPHAVTASITINTARSCEFSSYSLDFGDGSSPLTFNVPGGRCAEVTQSIPHTYHTPGEYTIKIQSGPHSASHKILVTQNPNPTNTGYTGTGTGTGTTGTSEYDLCTLVAGSIVINTTPRQCQLPDGRRFTQGVTSGTGTGTGTGTTDSGLVVNPGTGNAPLTIQAQYYMRTGDPYEIDWGDGTNITRSGTFAERGTLPAGSTVFSQPPQFTAIPHTYNSAGTKVVTLKIGRYELEGNVYVWKTRFFNQQVVVTGGSGTGTGGDSMSASPTSGGAPLTVTFNVRINGSGSCSGGTYTLDFGNGQRAELTYPANNCQYRDVIVTHQYTANGNYIAKLYAFPPSQIGTITQPVASATITVSGTGTASTTDPQLTVTPGYGGVLRQVQVTFRKDNCHGFSINWGDNSAIVTESPSTSTCGTVEQKTFTHTYPTVTGSVSYTINLAVASSTTRTATIVIVGS